MWDAMQCDVTSDDGDEAFHICGDDNLTCSTDLGKDQTHALEMELTTAFWTATPMEKSNFIS